MQNFIKLFVCISLVLLLSGFANAQYATDWVADFEVTDGGYADNGWWNSSTVTQMADPTPRAEGGVIAWNFTDASGSGVGISKGDVEITAAKNFAAWLYLPSDIPDSTVIRFFGQTKPQWSHRDSIINYAKDLPKETWFPLIFPTEAYYVADSTGFNHHAGDEGNSGFGQFGLQIISPAVWAGTVYIDDVVRLGTEGDAVSYFDIGTDISPWSDAAWGDALSVLQVIPDPTGGSSGGVLEVGINGTRGTISSTQLATMWSYEDLGYKIWLPASFPDSMLFRTAFQDNAHWGDNFYVDFLGEDLPKEKWIYIDWPIKTYYMTDSTALTPYPPHGIGRIYIDFQALDAAATSYSGSVYIDEVDLLSSQIASVEKKLESPVVTLAAAIDSVLDDTNGDILYHHLIEWEDLAINAGETYNIYMSESGPITDVNALGVVNITREIPRGVQEWMEIIYEGTALTRYYAVTASGIEGAAIVEKPVRPDTSNTGAVTSTQGVLYNEVPLVSSFNFVVDGDLTEFTTMAETFTRMKLHVQEANGQAREDNGDVWDPDDLDFNAYMVMTTDNLYIGFDVYDDNPSGANQPWEGDGLDVFGVMTDWTGAQTRFAGTNVPSGGEGGYRISYAPNAATIAEQLQKNGGGAWVDATGVNHGKEIFDDGYVVEMMIPWTAMAAEFGTTDGSTFVPADGMLYPSKIDVNDCDNDPPDSTRTLQGHWGAIPGNTTSWQRSDGWTPLVITETPLGTAIDDYIHAPRTTKLYANYPNPFNPVTTIKYDLGKTSNVKLNIFNTLGQKVKTLVDKRQQSGKYEVYWHGNNEAGRQLPTGVYFLQFKTAKYSKVHKMILMK